MHTYIYERTNFYALTVEAENKMQAAGMVAALLHTTQEQALQILSLYN